jgi:hypothetical protein
MPGWVRDLALIVALCALGGAVHRVNVELESTVAVQSTAGPTVFPNGKALRVLSLGFDRLVADLFWLRTVYYVGDEQYSAAGYPAADALADLVTDIDPSFTTVYVVMSGAIGYLKGDPDGAIALLEKGTRNVSYWKLHFLLGFNYFTEKLAYDLAAREMETAAKLGGPPYLPLLASRLYASAGDPETALAFIRARLAEEKEPETRKALEKRAWDLWITRDLDRIDAAITSYVERKKEAPRALEDLVRLGVLAEEPRDPRGGRYRIVGGKAGTELSYDRLNLHRAYAPMRPAPAAQPDEGGRP